MAKHGRVYLQQTECFYPMRYLRVFYATVSPYSTVPAKRIKVSRLLVRREHCELAFIFLDPLEQQNPLQRTYRLSIPHLVVHRNHRRLANVATDQRIFDPVTASPSPPLRSRGVRSTADTHMKVFPTRYMNRNIINDKKRQVT